MPTRPSTTISTYDRTGELCSLTDANGSERSIRITSAVGEPLWRAQPQHNCAFASRLAGSWRSAAAPVRSGRPPGGIWRSRPARPSANRESGRDGGARSRSSSRLANAVSARLPPAGANLVVDFLSRLLDVNDNIRIDKPDQGALFETASAQAGYVTTRPGA